MDGKDSKSSASDKLVALTKIYETIIHEINHVGDLKDGSRSADEVGCDAMNEVYHEEDKEVTEEDETKRTIRIKQADDFDANLEDLSGKAANDRAQNIKTEKPAEDKEREHNNEILKQNNIRNEKQ